MTAPASSAGRPFGAGPANALVFLASGAVLVLEILGVRLLAPYVGLTLETTTSIIGAALAGIAAGAAAGGRAADRLDARRLLPLLLAGGGLLCLAAVPLVRTFGENLPGSRQIAALILALLVLFPPAFVLSAVTPVVARLELRDLDHTGRVVGRLSAWATAGALVGTFATGFVLVPLMPTSAAVYVTGGSLLGAALLVSVLVRVAARGIALGCAAGALALAALGQVLDSPCDAETDYHCAQLTGPADMRLLILDDLLHASVDLEDPERLHLAYSRWMGDAIAALPPGPLDALYIGGGGFAIPRHVAATRPGSRARVLEVDAELVELARRRLALETSPALQVRVGDARVTLREEAEDSADLVVGDAFGGRAVPWHLATTEFSRDVRRVLRPGGLYVLNVIDQGRMDLLRAEAATLLEVFADVRLVIRLDGEGEPLGGNSVLLASDRPLGRGMRSGRLGARTLLRPAVVRFAGDAEALTDDDAPADQLIGVG